MKCLLTLFLCATAFGADVGETKQRSANIAWHGVTPWGGLGNGTTPSAWVNLAYLGNNVGNTGAVQNTANGAVFTGAFGQRLLGSSPYQTAYPSNLTVSCIWKTTTPSEFRLAVSLGTDVWLGLLSTKAAWNIAPSVTVSAPTNMDTGRHHVVGTYGRRIATLYVDGVRQASLTNSIGNPTGALNIGQYSSGSTYTWKGTIYEVRIYSAELSANEVAALYKETMR